METLVRLRRSYGGALAAILTADRLAAEREGSGESGPSAGNIPSLRPDLPSIREAANPEKLVRNMNHHGSVPTSAGAWPKSSYQSRAW